MAPPPPMLLPLPRRLLVAGGAKPRSFFNYSLLCVGRGCGRSPSAPSRSRGSSGRRFSSNAEQSTGSRRRWWSDETQFDGDEDDEEFEFEDEEGSSFGGSPSWNQAFEEPWFAKVWRAYGYVLPVILVSILAATGPRAFLMAMAIPLAQSALSFAVRAYSTTFGRRRREEYDDDGDYYYYSDYRSSGWEESEDGQDGSSYSSSSRYQQQPWAKDGKPEGSVPTAGSDDTVSASSNTRRESGSGSTGFGGWDELDAGDDQYVRGSRRRSAGASPPADTTAANTATGGGASSSVGRRRPRPEAAARRSRPRRSRAAAAARYRRQSPLLMRLLVAVFPFLGSWFRVML